MAEVSRHQESHASCDNSGLRLPIDPLIPEIMEHLRHANTLVLEAPPGAGKTTRVPPALLALDSARGAGAGAAPPGRAPGRALRGRGAAASAWARPSATRSASKKSPGPRTRLRFLTEGVLTRRLHERPATGRAPASWCWTNSTSATSKATSRSRCCAACSAPRGPTSASW